MEQIKNIFEKYFEYSDFSGDIGAKVWSKSDYTGDTGNVGNDFFDIIKAIQTLIEDAVKGYIVWRHDRKLHPYEVDALYKDYLADRKEEPDYIPCLANGLMWSKEADKEMCWDDAMAYAKSLREGGYSDWRLPTIKELQNVFDYEKGEALIPFSQSSFWSSTEQSDNASPAWYTSLYNGTTRSLGKGNGNATRCVRRDDGEEK